MNSRNHSKKAGANTINDRFGEWRLVLEKCGRKPARKNVHALRVVTLRLQAEVEQNLAEELLAGVEGKAISRFRRQAEKLRKALGPVRELDVWMDALEGLRTSLSQNAGYVPRSTGDAILGIERLEERLKRKRRGSAKKLMAEIEKRGTDLVAASEEVEAALPEYVGGEGKGMAQEIAARFREMSGEFSHLDAENLHEFRKGIRTVRYLAEAHAAGDAMCAQIAAQMKKMQAAIGEWHDWEALAREVRDRGAKDAALGELLDTVTAESYEAAIAVVDGIRSRLNAKPDDAVEPALRGFRKPPSFEQIDPSAAPDKKLA
jgi:CHAD domain-containing protein